MFFLIAMMTILLTQARKAPDARPKLQLNGELKHRLDAVVALQNDGVLDEDEEDDDYDELDDQTGNRKETNSAAKYD